MPSWTSHSLTHRDVVGFVRQLLSVRGLVMLLAGVLAGVSLSALGRSAVVVPLVGSVPGVVVGGVGLAIALAVYRRSSCCGSPGQKQCGCEGDCGDRCSRGP